jgi:DcuC family C4-dicarboxylate transporter
VPTEWLVADPSNKAEVRLFESRLIGAAMLLGVAAASLTAPRRLQAIAAAFFTGVGFALTYIVGIIVAASCFGEGLKMIGLTRWLGELVQAAPPLLLPLALGLPLLFGLLSGSGMASTQAVFPLFVEPVQALGADPLLVGALVSMGAAAGRTMSPVSAVMLMSGRLTETNPLDLSRRVALPLLAGSAVIVVLAMLR